MGHKAAATSQEQKKRLALLLRVGLILMAAGYAAALMRIALFQYGSAAGIRQIRWIPFRFIYDLLTAAPGAQLKNTLGDFAVFLPLGILLPVFFRKLSFQKTMLAGGLTSLAFELLQLLIGCGVTDVDDLIRNTLGCAAGAALYFLVFYRLRKRRRAAWIALAFLAAFILPLCLLYAPATLPAQLTYVNQAALGGEERYTFDISAACDGIESGRVLLRPGTAVANGAYPAALSDSYPLAAGAACVLERQSYQYAINGSIQKITVAYETVSPEEAAAAIQAGSGLADLWIDTNGACELLVLKVYEN